LISLILSQFTFDNGSVAEDAAAIQQQRFNFTKRPSPQILREYHNDDKSLLLSNSINSDKTQAPKTGVIAEGE
jgi:hypothetical protein